MEITDRIISVIETPLFTKMAGSAPEMVIAWRNYCSMIPPSTSDNTSGATGMSAFSKI